MGGGTRQLDPESLGSHIARLYRAAYGLCGSPQDAEDLGVNDQGDLVGFYTDSAGNTDGMVAVPQHHNG